MNPAFSPVLFLFLFLGSFGVVTFFFLWLARRASRKRPDYSLFQKLDPLDAAFFGVMVLALVVVTTMRHLAPETPLVAWLKTPAGFFVAFVGTWFVLTIVQLAIVRLGRLAKRRRGT